MEPYIRLTREKIDLNELRSLVASSQSGALLVFEGVVRNHDEGKKIDAIEYEAYESMAKKELARIWVEAGSAWPEVSLAIAHRIGLLHVGETSLAVVAASPHRADTFACVTHVIDRTKRSVPIWKQERFENQSWWKGQGDIWHTAHFLRPRVTISSKEK